MFSSEHTPPSRTKQETFLLVAIEYRCYAIFLEEPFIFIIISTDMHEEEQCADERMPFCDILKELERAESLSPEVRERLHRSIIGVELPSSEVAVLRRELKKCQDKKMELKRKY